MIEILAIGDELLRGTFANTNAAFLSRMLHQAGWRISRHTTVADEAHVLEKEIAAALERSTIVITTGGLGPTCDDLTRQVMAKLFQCDFYFDETVAEDLKRRYGPSLLSLKDQATIPRAAKPLLNGVGTAPGLLFHKKDKLLIALPGVPVEMETLFVHQILPYLQKHFTPKEKITSQLLHFCLLVESEIDPLLRKFKQKYPDIEVGIYPTFGQVSVCLSAENPSLLEAPRDELLQAFSSHLFPAAEGKIEEAIHQWMLTHNKTLGLAESCTGGAIAARLTALAGASNYFLGSIVAYSNGVKHRALHVAEETIKEQGAVSSDVVKAMHRGCLLTTGADYAIAVTGIAGPSGGSPEKPVGLVWAAIGEKGKEPHVESFRITGNRAKIIQGAASRVLGLLWRRLAFGI